MNIHISRQEYALLRRYIEELCGISLGNEKVYLVENRLSGLVHEAGCKSFGELYHKLKNDPNAGNLRTALLDAIATNETLWFRDLQHFRLLEDTLLPRLKDEIEEGRRERIAIWSAACSTGQEPYSIAMTVREFFFRLGSEKDCASRVRITATDISHTSLEVAKKGCYSDTAIKRGMTPSYLLKYFRKYPDHWRIDPVIQKMISFDRYNLMEPPPPTFGSFDLVFLRNVIIYFSDAVKRAIFKKISRLLSPRGYLFLGTGETINGYTESFEMVESNGGAYFKLRL